jgi:hypothetical protein
MKRLLTFTALGIAALLPLILHGGPGAGLDGRWDLTVKIPGDQYPSWVEIKNSAGTPEVRVVGRVASAHPATNVKVEGSRIVFHTQEWFGKNTEVDWVLQLAGSRLKGTQKRGDITGQITGERAPTLDRPMPAAWSQPEPLFNGKDMAGWETLFTEPGKAPESHWAAKNGELVNEAPGANIRTKRTFQDFKLHVEYNCPNEGNSGVYLRGRYEVQVEYETADRNDALHGMGAVYGFLEPSKQLERKPGEWETFDITLVGRHVTVVRNGTTAIDNQEIPGITGGAINSQEGQPGPIYIQGDHTGGMKYRNITISVPSKS